MGAGKNVAYAVSILSVAPEYVSARICKGNDFGGECCTHEDLGRFRDYAIYRQRRFLASNQHSQRKKLSLGLTIHPALEPLHFEIQLNNIISPILVYKLSIKFASRDMDTNN